jgi:hypothetical protein
VVKDGLRRIVRAHETALGGLVHALTVYRNWLRNSR